MVVTCGVGVGFGGPRFCRELFLANDDSLRLDVVEGRVCGRPYRRNAAIIGVFTRTPWTDFLELWLLHVQRGCQSTK